MITVEELKAAIAECQGERNPNANTCIKLAAYYTILHELQGDNDKSAYSFTPVSTETKVSYLSETEFGKIVEGKPIKEVFSVIDELITVIQAIQPRLYDGLMRKLNEISPV